MAECGTCGGASCRDRFEAVGLTADDCCTQRINSFGVLCDDSETAPCIIGSGECFRPYGVVNNSESHPLRLFPLLYRLKAPGW